MPAMSPPESTLHPYARISDPIQRKGGGLQRQGPEAAEAIAAFAQQHGFAVAKRTLVDDGVSAFRGRHLSPEHELGKFLDEAERGLIPPGDCLLIELWDRLSRQDIWAAIGLVNDLRQLGIHIGRLDRGKLLRCDSTDPGDFFEAAVELMRGHSESAAKSIRNSAAWKRKRKAARAERRVLTRQLPFWVEEHGGGLRLVPERAAAVRRVFALAVAGYGQLAIVRRLDEEGVQPFGKTGRWTRSYVGLLLSDRRVLGECRPCETKGGKRVTAGEPIPGYFPAVVSEAEFFLARDGAAQRRIRRGRTGGTVNVFQGLVKDARSGLSYTIARSNSGHQVLKSAAMTEGKGGGYSFPLETFERAILSLLRELDPHAILNGDGGPDEVTALGAQFAAAEAELAEVAADLDAHGYSPTLGKRARDLEAKKHALGDKLAAARQKAAHPLAETWGQAHTLIDAVGGAADPEDVRLRLRGALRRIVAEIRLLVVPRSPDRLAAVQVWFKRDEPGAAERQRGYLVMHRFAKANQFRPREQGGWLAKSLADVAGPEDLDLRERDQAAALAEELAEADLAELAAKMAR
jgi:DNA invertase Pin-like site-specific DNA recombinase